jgi:hypothetical protein
MGQNAGYTTTVEYIKETTFGTPPTNPAMQWIGIVTDAKFTDKPKSFSTRYFTDADYTDPKSAAYKHIKTVMEAGVEIEYVPQGILDGFLGFALGGDTSCTGLVDGIKSVTIGAIITGETNKYLLYKGCVVDEFTLTIPEDDVLMCSAKFTAADATAPSTTDYIGTGSNATESTDAMLTCDDVSAIQLSTDNGKTWANATDIVREIELSISNKNVYLKDLASANSTHIAGVVNVGKDVKLGLELYYDDLDLLTQVRALTQCGFKFTIDKKTFTLTGVQFPEYPLDIKPDEVIGDKIESLQVTGLTIA